jgi:hypothetical protein
MSILPLSTIFLFYFFIVPTGGIFFYQFHPLFPCLLRGRRGRDRMVVGFTTTRPISKVGVRTPFMARCNRYNNKLLAQGRWFSPGTPASSTTYTSRHDIAEILLKVALNTINQIKSMQVVSIFFNIQ